jgi:2-succinyl-6-hydroxy-2,4-cyclohexadiene-1-carboxylate synthase
MRPKKLDTTKPIIILLHGFASTSDDWLEIMQILPTKYQIIAVDLVGFGRSSVPDNSKYYSQTFQVKLLDEIINNVQSKDVFIVGYSMGGRLALSYVAKYFSKLKGLVVESSTAGIIKTSDRVERIKSDEELAAYIESNKINKFVERWTSLELFNSQKKLPKEKIEKIKAEKLNLNPIGLSNSLKGFSTGRMNHLWNVLPNIYIPVLLVTGELDNKYCEINSKMNKKFPESSHQIVKEAGHNVHLEKPNEFVNLLHKFFDSIIS